VISRGDTGGASLIHSENVRPPRWQRTVLLAACIHCSVWSLFIMGLPELSSKVYGFAEPPQDVHLWQGTGLFIGLLAVGYGMAAGNPRQHWGIVLIGLLAKVLGAIGMTVAVVRGQVSANVLWLLPIDDVIWWWPFWRIVRDNWRATLASHPPDCE